MGTVCRDRAPCYLNKGKTGEMDGEGQVLHTVCSLDNIHVFCILATPESHRTERTGCVRAQVSALSLADNPLHKVIKIPKAS